MSLHVAILLPKYLTEILDGSKTVESRLMKNSQPPLGCVKQGDRIYFKQSAGPFRATAVAANVEEYHDLTVESLRGLCTKYNPKVRGEANYWQAKRESRYAVFVTLREVEPIDVGPEFRGSSWKAWFVLDPGADPMLTVPLSDGAIRNRYVRPPRGVAYFEPGAFTLLLPDGSEVVTGLTRRGLIRWRGWAELFADRPAAIRFVRVAPRRYRVTVHGS